MFDNYEAHVKLDGKTYSLGLWDSSGQEDYERLRPLSYPGTHIFLICFSVISRSSFKNVHKWYKEIRTHCPDTPIILVGTKKYWREKQEAIEMLNAKGMKPITYEEGLATAKHFKVDYMECSAMTGKGLRAVFEQVIKKATSPVFRSIGTKMLKTKEQEKMLKTKEQEKKQEEHIDFRMIVFSAETLVSFIKKTFPEPNSVTSQRLASYLKVVLLFSPKQLRKFLFWKKVLEGPSSKIRIF